MPVLLGCDGPPWRRCSSDGGLLSLDRKRGCTLHEVLPVAPLVLGALMTDRTQNNNQPLFLIHVREKNPVTLEH